MRQALAWGKRVPGKEDCRCIGPEAGKGKRVGETAVWVGKSEQGRVGGDEGREVTDIVCSLLDHGENFGFYSG